MDRKKTVSIIVPVYNENRVIVGALRHLSTLGADEIIVVDGGSSDGTLETLKKHFPGIQCFETVVPGRSLQMNLGAGESTGDVLLFVHADMTLPDHAVDFVRERAEKGYDGGGFTKRYDRSTGLLRIYLYLMNTVYLKWWRCLVGTNAIFVTRKKLEQMNGFPEVEFLEDLIFSDRLREAGRTAVIDSPVLVSSRKYFKNGIIKQILRNIRIVLGYRFLNEQPVKLRAIYQRQS